MHGKIELDMSLLNSVSIGTMPSDLLTGREFERTMYKSCQVLPG